eukprot:TRINITY_DN3170_c0_g2_i1.p1 TRINITY_DN3170_c0_g2~~TRINITY_DN3170_c0_g2_i1.p1  ORF type:complete len:389 (+),score=200.41 TRINITY_DN3170_c0_g2_i1:49-1215(+)
MAGQATQHEKSIVLSFLDFLGTSGKVESEQLEVIQALLQTSFGLSAEDKSTVALVDVFPKEDDEAEFDEKKWQEFLDVITEKGYFKGCEPGSDEYKGREEKARAKFALRSNPYEGLSADQLKAKGNELMTKGQHKSAVGYYTKAIEMDPSNGVYYCNRAAAYTHLSQYKEAVRDCEKSTQLKPDYSKAHSRLGTAHFYLQNFPAAVEAFQKACELDPANEGYKQDLLSAQEKAANPVAAGGPPGMPGFDMGAISQMMSNPQFQQMAQSVMQNPAFGQMVQNMTQNMTGEGGMPDMSKMAEMWGQGGVQNMPGIEGEHGDTIPTPFGQMSRAAMEKLRDEEFANNPKFAQLQEDMKREGPMAIMKHMNDPEVMDVMGKFTNLFANQPPQ